MRETSKRSALSAGLRQSLERRSREIEEVTASELNRLAASLHGVAADALRSIASDMERRTAAAQGELDRTWRGARQEAERLQGHLRRAWLRPLAIGLSLCLGISLGLWGLTRWLSVRIEGQLQLQARLAAEIEEQQRTLGLLQEGTWGVWLHEGSEGRYVVLPPGAELDTGWTIGGRPSVRFSSK